MKAIPPTVGRLAAFHALELQSSARSCADTDHYGQVFRPQLIAVCLRAVASENRFRLRGGVRGAVGRQETRKARDVVGVAVLKNVGALRVQEFAMRVEHEQVRITRHLWITRKKCPVLVRGTLVDFQGHEVSVTQSPNVSVVVEKLVHDVAPVAPIAANYQKNVASRALGFGESFGQIRARITLGIVASYRDVARRGLRCSLPGHFADRRGGIAKREGEEKQQ